MTPVLFPPEMITPEKLQTPEKPLDGGEASIYVLIFSCFDKKPPPKRGFAGRIMPVLVFAAEIAHKILRERPT